MSRGAGIEPGRWRIRRSAGFKFRSVPSAVSTAVTKASLVAIWAAVTLSFSGGAVAAQTAEEASEGSATAAALGGLLGMYSGATLGAVGSMIPCNQTYIGVRCVRLVGAATGALGLAGGIALGATDTERVGNAAIGAGLGFAAGFVAGTVIRSQADTFSWADVVTLGFVGGAYGASALGATVGLVTGSAVGLVLWQAIPSFDLPNAIGVALAGMAVGGIGSWIYRAADSGDSSGGAPVTLTVPLRVQF